MYLYLYRVIDKNLRYCGKVGETFCNEEHVHKEKSLPFYKEKREIK